MAATESLTRSFSDALYERYGDFDSTFDELKNDCDVVYFVGSSPKKTESGLVLHTSTVVLTDERISHVGDPHAIVTSCPHVELVDVSSNVLSDWDEIALLLSSLPHVKTINLSFNPFPAHLHKLPSTGQWSNLSTLCLNASSLRFEMIIELLSKMPNLEELQICSNNYSMIAAHGSFRHEQLKRLYISDNRLAQWKSICQLGWLFPRLETLLASDNPLESFRSNDDLQKCFPHLHTLSVDEVQIAHWDDIVALTKLPRLQALRIYSAPLLKPFTKDERFFLLLGHMQNVRKLNGSDIIGNERETNERRFIRYYSQREEKPARYFELIEQHGQLKPLADIQIRAPHSIQVRLVHHQVIHEKEIDVRQTVQQFKKYLHELFHLPIGRLRVFYVDDVAFTMGFGGKEELKYPQRLLHTYNIHDGDQFHIELKSDPVKFPRHHHHHQRGTVDRPRRTRETSVDTADVNNDSSSSSFSSTSSEDDKSISPFSFDSLQRLAHQTDAELHQALIELDQLYPSFDEKTTTTARRRPIDHDEDTDLLVAAAVAWRSIQKD